MVRKNKKNGGLVYSTDHGRMCPECQKATNDCVCDVKNAKVISGDAIVRVSRQIKGRKGKGVSIITGVPLEALELAALGKKLKKKCGSGGTVKNGMIEIQGDHREVLVAELKKLGWIVKLAGG